MRALGWRLAGRERFGSLFVRTLLMLSLVLGVTALVALDLFSRRIGTTVARDSKNVLAADFRVQSWRPFDKRVLGALAKDFSESRVVKQVDVTSSLRRGDEVVTASFRGLEGSGYPFYGPLVLEPVQSIRDLEQSGGIWVDKSLRARGWAVGDRIEIGAVTAQVQGFIVEEPQALASAFAPGVRVLLPLHLLEKSGLMGRGSRVFHQLLIRSDEKSSEFKRRFRAQVPDPHWRLITPERANNQAQRVLSRMESFLALVGLVAILLSGIGLYTVFRSFLVERLPQFLTLRCLGFRSQDLYLYGLRSLLPLLAGSWLLGLALGFGTEKALAAWAASSLGVSLSDVEPWSALLISFCVTLVTSLVAVFLPLRESLRVPVSEVLRDTELTGSKVNRLEMGLALVTVLALARVVSSSTELTLIFVGLFCAAAVLLSSLSWLLGGWLQTWARGPRILPVLGALQFARRGARSHLMVVALGLGLFLIQSVILLGGTLRDQVDLSKRSGIPNLYLLNLSNEERQWIESRESRAQFFPITQARLLSINGKPVADLARPEPDENEEGEADNEGYSRTREYFVTARSELGLGEKVVAGKEFLGEPMFDDASQKLVRVSIEEEFAERRGLPVGSIFVLEIAGVELKAVVQSHRRVDWGNFRPNFFIVAHPEDLEGAPFDFVATLRVDDAGEREELQKTIVGQFPHIAVLDGESISRRLSTLMNQLALSVLGVSVFAFFSGVLVFLGILLSKRRELRADLSLWKCLGLRPRQLQRILLGELLWTALVATALAALCSALGSWVLGWGVFDMSPRLWSWESTVLVVVAPVFLVGLAWLLIRPLLRVSGAELFRQY
jgi:putative ABC transport system permease protein